jgi:pimeloyl-ACP methyl ester carboxylesterase
MAATQKPTILFVHGSWHNPNHFTPIRTLFESQGFHTECPLQATYNAKPHSTLSLKDDVEVIQATLTELVNHGKEVIVVMHSYGGVLGTEAVLESFGKTACQKKGLPGGVTRLLYLAAFVLPLGASLTTIFGDLPPFIKVEVSVS